MSSEPRRDKSTDAAQGAPAPGRKRRLPERLRDFALTLRHRLTAELPRLPGLRKWVLLTMLGALGIFGASVGAVHAFRASVGHPEPKLGDDWNRSGALLDRRGRLLWAPPNSEGLRGTPIPLEAMGQRLVRATLVSEDRRFYEHNGVDGRAIVRAVLQGLYQRRLVSGASTITQQLVKLLDTEGGTAKQGRGRTLGVKLREALRAQNLERVLDKPAILESYLNRLNYGRNRVGPFEAARGYFGKTPDQLSWAEAATLAVLPRAPSYLDPIRHPERVRNRREKLLRALHEVGDLSTADLERALAEPVAPEKPVFVWRARHFVRWVKASVPHPQRTQRTSLDLDLQLDAEALVERQRARLSERNASNAAAIVIDNRTGEVLAYVGSLDFEKDAAGQVDHVSALRQPGSALKPFLYALAFEQGKSPHEPLADVPAQFGNGPQSYAPTNFDGKYHGPVPAREALAGSLNVPAVRLAAELGAKRFLQQLRRLGLVNLRRSAGHYGAGLALGSGEVSLVRLARAYAVLARGGRAFELTPLQSEGLPSPDEAEPIIAAEAAALVSEALSDPLARVRGLGGRGPFDLGFPVAVKTGTSSGYRDAWCLGYTREFTVGVWVGNSDGGRTDHLTGASGAGPIFRALMHRVMRDIKVPAPLWEPELLQRVRFCPLSGKPAGPACPSTVERFAAKRGVQANLPADDQPRHDPLHQEDVDPDSSDNESVEHARRPHHEGVDPDHESRCTWHRFATPLPTSSDKQPRYRCGEGARTPVVVLPPVYAPWLAEQPPGAPGHDPQGLPWLSQHDVANCGAGEAAFSSLQVLTPEPDALVVLSRRGDENQRLEVRAMYQGDPQHSPNRVEFILDGKRIAESPAPFRASLKPRLGDHILVVRAKDARAPVQAGQVRFSVR